MNEFGGHTNCELNHWLGLYSLNRNRACDSQEVFKRTKRLNILRHRIIYPQNWIKGSFWDSMTVTGSSDT